MFLLRAPTSRNCKQYLLELARLLVIVFRIGPFQAQRGVCCEGTVKVWRRIVSVVWVTSWLLLQTGEVSEFREGISMAKTILHAFV